MTPSCRVQVCSFDTLHSRAVRNDWMAMPPADLVLVDEAHLSISETRQEILGHYPDAVVIGLTATPVRGDGRGLGEIYDDLVIAASVRELTEQGSLVPVRYFAPSAPDLAGIKIQGGDYVERELGKRMDDAKLVGDIVHNWHRLAEGKSTVVFCVTRAHSRHVRDEFLKAGIRAEHVDGETPLDERKAILERVSSGETTVLTNVYVATYGLDIPRLECAVLARPTKNLGLYIQTAGRVLRPFEGKSEALIIDHAGAVLEHGFVDDPIPWSLDGDDSVSDRKTKQEQEQSEPKEIVCGDCGTVFKSARRCPNCGHEMIPPKQAIPVHQADLQEIERSQRKQNREWTKREKGEFFGGLKRIAQERGYKPGWAANQYRAKFGVWPNAVKDHPPIKPSDDVLGWVKHQQIKFAKRRAA